MERPGRGRLGRGAIGRRSKRPRVRTDRGGASSSQCDGSAAADALAALDPATRAEVSSIRTYLQADGSWRSRFYLPSGSTFACGVRPLGANAGDSAYRYVYVFCGSFLGETTASSGSGPLRVAVEGAGAAMRVIGVEEPISGNGWADDVRRLFPASLHELLFSSEDVSRAAFADALAEAVRLQGRS